MSGESVEDIRTAWESHVDYLEIYQPHGWAGAKDYRKIDRKLKTCGRPFRGPVQVLADGTVVVCCFDTDGEMVIGDTHKDSISDILHGEEMQIIQASHLDGNVDGILCGGCDQLNKEKTSPLLYSNRDKELSIGRTSSMKFKLE
jgi:hypothetical protein